MRQSFGSWSLKKLYFKLFFAFLILQNSLGYETFQEVRRQGLIPLVRLGRNSILSALGGKEPRGNMIVYPRVGRKASKYQHNLNLLPQTDYQAQDDGSLSSLDYGTPNMDGDSVESSHPNFNKRLVFIPRVGRK